MNVKTIGIALLVLVAASFALMGNAAAAAQYVSPGDSIQAAINGAADGDTIVLMDGDYVENVIVNKSVAIMSYGQYNYFDVQGYVDQGFLWWVYNTNVIDFTFEYDGAVAVAAADDKLSVFTVESDNVLIMNIQMDYTDSGTVDYYTRTYQYIPMWILWDHTHYDWEYIIYDNPMTITGAYKSDAAGVEVVNATGTQLINLVSYGNDNGIKLTEATDTYIEDVEMNDNNKEGLLATGCDGIAVYDSVVVNSGKRGVEIEDSANVEMDGVLVLDSGKDNIEMVAVDGVTMFNVVSDNANKNGMSLDACTDVNIEQSAVFGSGRAGLYMNACDGTMVDGFEAADNDNYGLKIMYTDNIAFSNIDAHDNDENIKMHDCTGCTGMVSTP